MEILIMLAGAGIFCCGFFVGKMNRHSDYQDKYMKLYGKTNGLMEPVKRGGKRDER